MDFDGIIRKKSARVKGLMYVTKPPCGEYKIRNNNGVMWVELKYASPLPFIFMVLLGTLNEIATVLRRRIKGRINNGVHG